MPTPKSNRKLTEAQKQLLKQWIDQGAKWGKHWAFERIERPKLPANVAKNPIDAFVRAKLAEKGMKPSPQADAETLLRRVSLDLIGLPPRPEQLTECDAGAEIGDGVQPQSHDQRRGWPHRRGDSGGERDGSRGND
jgi:hypothetical protein